MSDSSCHVKIEFSVYKKTFKWDAYINYSQEYDGGVDRRISEWFENAYSAALADWEEECRRDRREELEKAEEARELAEYERLREKFGG